MTDQEPIYEAIIFLATDIKGAALDMVVELGELRAYRRAGNAGMAAEAFKRIEEAVKKAERSVASYKRAIAAARGLMTLAEYEGGGNNDR